MLTRFICSGANWRIVLSYVRNVCLKHGTLASYNGLCILLHCALSCAVYCNRTYRTCLYVCLFVGPPYYSKRAVFASLLSAFSRCECNACVRVIVVFAPSVKGLQQLLDVCSKFASSHNVIFNVTKSQCLIVKSRNDIITNCCPTFRICGARPYPILTVISILAILLILI